MGLCGILSSAKPLHPPPRKQRYYVLRGRSDRASFSGLELAASPTSGLWVGCIWNNRLGGDITSLCFARSTDLFSLRPFPVPQGTDQLPKMKQRPVRRGRGQPGNRRRTFSEPTLQRCGGTAFPLSGASSRQRHSHLLPWHPLPLTPQPPNPPSPFPSLPPSPSLSLPRTLPETIALWFGAGRRSTLISTRTHAR